MMFDKENLLSVRKYISELEAQGTASPTDFYIREFATEPGLLALILNGGFLKEEWKNFCRHEKRFIARLYEQYYVWRYFLLEIRSRSKTSTSITPLQRITIESKWDANDFFSYLLEEIITLEKISEGLDHIKDRKRYQPADAFEASCYFFLIAYHHLRDESTRDQYQNALAEALEHQGEFRGWAAAMLYKSELYEKFERKDRDLGIFKMKAVSQLEDWYACSGGEIFSTDTEVQNRLNDKLIEFNKTVKSGREDFSGSIKNWYDAKDPEFKMLVKRLVKK